MESHKTLTVLELITELSRYNLNLPVYGFTCEGTEYLEKDCFAVENKKDFPGLPDDFPDEYLCLF